jgi:uncharacterized protein (TIGR02996 family)
VTHAADDATYLALLRGVLAEPAEDTPRLALADWWDENAAEVPCGRCKGTGSVWPGHRDIPTIARVHCPACSGSGRVSDGRRERAEFVRAQCELAGWPCECDTSEERVYHDECRCNEREALRRRSDHLAALPAR